MFRIMKVCYFIPMLDYATGWGRWTVDLLEKIVEFGVEPVLIIPESQREEHLKSGLEFETHFWGPEPYAWFHQLYRINTRGLKDLFFIKKRYGALDGKGISLIHATDMYPWGVFAGQLKEKLNVPVIFTNHSKLLFNPWFSVIDFYLCRKAVKTCDRIVSVSDWSRKQIQNELGMHDEKFQFIHNGVDVDRLKKCSEELEAQTVRGSRGPVIISVTRFIKLKGIEMAVLAFKQIKDEMPDARYYIIGPHSNPEYVDYIKKIIAVHGIKDVYLTGKTGSIMELCAYYRMADVLVHTSNSESFPLIFYEAGYFNVPVVASAVGGVPEAVIDGENGLLVPAGDVAATARSIRKILTDAELAKRLGNDNYKKAMQCTARKVASEYYKIYQELIRTF